MTYKPYFDRTDWRRCWDHELIEAARGSNHELCIAIGERLDDLADLPDQLADMRAERDELDKRCDMLRRELDELQVLRDQYDELDRAHDMLRGELKDLHEALKGAGAEATE